MVEMLIASILVATLMATVWNLTSLYSGFLTAGRAQAEEQQLARSLIDIISTDLHALTLTRSDHSTVAVPPAMPSNESTGSGNESLLPSSADSFPGAVELPELESASVELNRLFGIDGGGNVLPTFDIRGRAHMLTLTVSEIEPGIEVLPVDEETGMPTLEEALSPDASTQTSEPDQLPGPPLAPEYRRVVYEFVPPRMAEGTSAESEDDLLPGLYRYEIPVEHLSLLTLDNETSRIEAPPELNNVSQMIRYLSEQGITSIKQEHVPEVVGCEFEYLTDTGWTSSWTPKDDGRMLQAVRIRLRLLSPDEYQELMTALGVTVDDDSEGDIPATAEEPLDLTAEFEAEQDPFEQFEPRTFERIVLLGTPKRLSLGESDETSFGQSFDAFTPPPFGGQP
ncbi:MAG: hypothetical protein KDA86_01025 [Planctomycetaceae bacterium]|nr:hypothetical protein [Planctomycetaceae bacterium]